MRPPEEARFILDTLQAEIRRRDTSLPKLPAGIMVDGFNAIAEMRAIGCPYWQENEWAGYYFDALLGNALRGVFRIRKHRKRLLFTLDQTWDVRVHDCSKLSTIPLGDVRATDRLFAEGRGYGIIILSVKVIPDSTGAFRQWVESQKGGASKYVARGRTIGRESRIRKKALVVQSAMTLYFPTLADFRAGVPAGWLDDHFGLNMKNHNGRLRPNPKYLLKLWRVPSQFETMRYRFLGESGEGATASRGYP